MHQAGHTAALTPRRIGILILLLACQSVAARGATANDTIASQLMARVGPPSAEVTQRFIDVGMHAAAPHALSAGERRELHAALARLPARHQRALLQRLHRLAFVDGISGLGNGLTSAGEADGSFDITLRADLFGQSLSQFLTAKEQQVFEDASSGGSIVVTASGANALGYVLLHEATHVVSAGSAINDGTDPAFSAGVWQDRSTLVSDVAAMPLAATVFRRQPARPTADAPVIYRSLCRSPFVSLYATSSAAEDFAELVAWQQIDASGGTLSIEVRDANGAVVSRHAPLQNPMLRERFIKAKAFID